MKEGPDIAMVAALIGDPARANMLTALLSGKALTVTELAAEAGVTVQTASGHLAKLTEGGLVLARKSGRHKYFAIANDEVAHALEALMGVAAGAGHLRVRTGPRNNALRHARVCYNHLAGEKGIELYDALIAKGYLRIVQGQLKLTETGRDFVTDFGIDLNALETGKAVLCRECLDWSERRSHLAGSLGRAVLSRMEELEWVQRDRQTRIVTFTSLGENAFQSLLAR